MLSPALAAQGQFNTFGGNAVFYPGGDSIAFEFENGSEHYDSFFATYYGSDSTGPLETGGDFFNFFVLGQYPSSYDPDLIDNNTVNETEIDIASATPPSSAAVSPTASFAPASTDTVSTKDSAASCNETLGIPAYPSCPDVAQADLGTDGWVSGKKKDDSHSCCSWL